MMADRIAVNELKWGSMIAKAAGTSYNPDVDINICTLEDEVLLGGICYTGYTGESICIHAAGFAKHWLTRDLLWIMYHYPFVQLGVNRIFCEMPESNLRILSFASKMGFSPIARIEGVFPGGGACIMAKLEREDCRFLKLTPRTIKSSATLN